MRTLAGLCTLLMLLSGCAGPGGGSAPPALDDGLEELDLQATSDTGVIRGVVVDEAIRPLAGVLVTLSVPGGTRSANTTAEGLFGFDGLAPGTYFLSAQRLGYGSIQQSTDVRAGEDQPPAVRILLTRAADFAPYFELRVYEGYIQCTLSFLVLCGIANLYTGESVTNDRYAWTWHFQPNATLLQAELVWDSTQSLSPTMYFDMRPDGDCDEGFGNSTEGESPVFATINGTEFTEGGIDLEQCGVYFALFSGHNEPLPRWPVTGWGFGATVQQQFRMYVHTFYDFLPPPGWQYSVDGDPTLPA